MGEADRPIRCSVAGAWKISASLTTDQLTLTWHALFAVHQRLPAGWCLVGGQLVHLLCAERGFEAIRPTLDADAMDAARTAALAGR